MTAARQLTLLRSRSERPSIEERWRAFHAANPGVYEAFERLALQVAGKRKRFGAKAIWERMRWDLAMAVEREEDEPKLNNSFTSLYVREFLRRHPECSGLFETRERRAAQ